MRTCVYIDGFNLYYGALRNTPYKWLDPVQMCREILDPNNQILKTKYFTANITGRPSDPNQPKRQAIYLDVLQSMPDVEVIRGRFFRKQASGPLVGSPTNNPQMARIWTFEEKGSDVNIASHMLMDGFQGRYDVAVLVSNDSDLAEPVKIIRSELNKSVVVISPYNKPSTWLRREASAVKVIRKKQLAAAQLPSVVVTSKGRRLTKPNQW